MTIDLKYFHLITVLLITGFAQAATTKEHTYTNPVIDEIGPADPCVIFYNETYYLYPTGGDCYFVYTSPDLVHWTKGTKVFVSDEKNVWAPDIFYNQPDKTFYLYYTVNSKIGVATANKPDGIFKDRVLLVKNAIDAHMFCDDDGQYFLYYVKFPQFQIYVQQMKNPLEKDGQPIKLIWPTDPWEKNGGEITEGPWMLKHDNTYYLLYSGSGAHTLDYAIGYATAKSPTGPFKKFSGNPIVKKNDKALGPGHGCVIMDVAKNLWSVYHQQKDDTQRWNRFICLDPLWFDEQGILHGKATRGTPQPSPAIRNKRSISN